ncbi:MAG: hypothetical protein QNK79_04995 [Synechococcus sp. ArSW.bin.68]
MISTEPMVISGHLRPFLIDGWLVSLSVLSFVVLSKTVFAARVVSACQLGRRCTRLMSSSFSFKPAIEFAISQDKVKHEDEVDLTKSSVGIDSVVLRNSDGVVIASIYKRIIKEFEDSKRLEEGEQTVES